MCQLLLSPGGMDGVTSGSLHAASSFIWGCSVAANCLPAHNPSNPVFFHPSRIFTAPSDERRRASPAAMHLLHSIMPRDIPGNRSRIFCASTSNPDLNSLLASVVHKCKNVSAGEDSRTQTLIGQSRTCPICARGQTVGVEGNARHGIITSHYYSI